MQLLHLQPACQAWLLDMTESKHLVHIWLHSLLHVAQYNDPERELICAVGAGWRRRSELGLPENQKCVVLLDCWSVHKSAQFQGWMRETHQNFLCKFLPAGECLNGIVSEVNCCRSGITNRL